MPAPVELLVERISRVRDALKEFDNAPMLITEPANIGWLTGIPADFQKDAHVLIDAEKAYLITDGRYENRIPEIPGLEPFIWAGDHPHRYPDLKKLVGGQDKLILDAKGLALDIFLVLKEMVDVKELEVPSGFIDRLRMIKGDLELKLIREAVSLAIDQFTYMVKEWLPANFETATDKDFAETLESWPLDKGADGISFESIVAMDHDADTPHPDCDRAPRPLKDGNVMLVDWGITYKGVCTDMTRMIVFGNELPPIIEGMKLLQEKWMDAVVREMQPGKEAYHAGNEYLFGMRAAGIDKPFHGAGHGTGGAYVHELPRVSFYEKEHEDFGIPFPQAIVLEPGMIITSEPGMYEKGVGAYRTENMILITKDGQEALDKELPLDPFFMKLK